MCVLPVIEAPVNGSSNYNCSMVNFVAIVKLHHMLETLRILLYSYISSDICSENEPGADNQQERLHPQFTKLCTTASSSDLDQRNTESKHKLEIDYEEDFSIPKQRVTKVSSMQWIKQKTWERESSETIRGEPFLWLRYSPILWATTRILKNRKESASLMRSSNKPSKEI